MEWNALCCVCVCVIIIIIIIIIIIMIIIIINIINKESGLTLSVFLLFVAAIGKNFICSVFATESRGNGELLAENRTASTRPYSGRRAA